MQNATQETMTRSARKAQKNDSHGDLGLLMRHVPGKGKGVFATRDFPAGTTVLEFLGALVEVNEVDDLTHCLQVGPTTFLGPSGSVDDYVNHSCAPNTGIQDREGRIFLFALSPIKSGDEISFDYSTTQTGGHWHMQCLCGKATCRGHIGDFRDLPSSVRQFYIDRNAVLPFVAADVQV